MAPSYDETAASARIDRISFILGMITAFAECVTNESKRLAFSPPFYAEDYAGVKKEAERIAKDLSVHLWLESNDELSLETHDRQREMWRYSEQEMLDTHDYALPSVELRPPEWIVATDPKTRVTPAVRGTWIHELMANIDLEG